MKITQKQITEIRGFVSEIMIVTSSLAGELASRMPHESFNELIATKYNNALKARGQLAEKLIEIQKTETLFDREEEMADCIFG